jgi:predicted lipoprotein with Yx(FWY)xxD motif
MTGSAKPGMGCEALQGFPDFASLHPGYITKEYVMRKLIKGAIAAGILSISIAAALAQTAPAKTADTSKGKALVDDKGMTLYIFDRDTSGKSNCNGQCATNWPPLQAAADAKPSGDWTVVSRDDGGKQWAYKGKPLYLWAKDTKPGDVTGDGVNSVWHIAAP